MPDSSSILPIEPSWKLLAVSPDMMDTKFCNKKFPFRWRSSLAISAFEPKAEDLPDNLCEGKITMLKVTATITGYQPSREETEEGYASFPNFPQEELDRALQSYFACYGALLNVAVFPNPNRKRVRRLNTIKFDNERPGTQVANPFVVQGVTFTGSGAENEMIDIHPTGGDGIAELNINNKLVIDMPATTKVVLRICHQVANGVNILAFSNGVQIDDQQTDTTQGVEHEVTIEGTGIDQVVLTHDSGIASLIGMSFETFESRKFNLNEFPHIIDVEPKVRDLIQASTESGEILTTSKSNIKTNKSLTHTENSQTGWKLSASGGEKDKYNVLGELNHSNSETEEQNWSVATDASRERADKQGSSTQVSQLYNLLNSYHVGTNRAQFLMLARPHVLQPTDHRTFVDGLRHIEGVQDFILIVARPPEMLGLCVEATLETGHFPEGLVPETPEPVFEESEETFKVTAFADNGFFGGSCNTFNETHTVESGWVVDTRPSRGSDAGHPGLQEIANDSNGQANSSLENYNYRRISDADVSVSGKICGQSLERDKARFDRTYKVFTRSVLPKPTSAEAKVPLDRLLITGRSLCVCYRSSESCPRVDPRTAFPADGEFTLKIIDEPKLQVSRRLLTNSLTGFDRTPAMKELLQQVSNAMTRSWRSPGRRPTDQAPTFLESDYFKDFVKRKLSSKYLAQPISRVKGVPEEMIKACGAETDVAAILEMNLEHLVRRTGLGRDEVLKARNALLTSGF